VRRLEVAFPTELLQAGEHFTSGVNAAGEVRGLASSARHIGITLAKVGRTGFLEEVELHSGGLLHLFVDSGAFSEVDFPPNAAPVVARPIEHATWIERLELAERLAASYRTRCYVVAPDRVGCQATTLERLARYAAHVAAIASHRAQIIVPVQKGAMSMSAFYAKACAVLGLRTAPIAGVPMRKDATSLEELAELVGSLPWFGARIHLLGLGPKAKYRRFEKVVALIKSIRPNATITSDSTQAIRGQVGRTNGRKGTPRALTIAQDRAHAAGLRGQAKKAASLADLGFQAIDAELEAANAAGWFDVELFDTLEEANAHRIALKAERDARELEREAA
jgi:hypothetical protein